jgi:hypothetical protein
VAHLATLQPDDGAIAALARAGICPVGSNGTAIAEGAALTGALRAGTFRVSVSDLVPRRASAALARGLVQFLQDGGSHVGWVVSAIQGSWVRPGEGLRPDWSLAVVPTHVVDSTRALVLRLGCLAPIEAVRALAWHILDRG